MEKFVKVIRAEVKDINEDKHTLTAVISTKKVDRDGDIVEPESFKNRLKLYKEHPVLLSSHNYGSLLKQIGRAVNVTVEDNQVSAVFEYFVGQGNQEADWAWVLAQRGLASYSIGFMGLQFEWIKQKDEQGNERITGRKFTEIELFEVSQVLIPSNRGALQAGRSIAQESLELCELAIKSIDKGEFKMDNAGDAVETPEEKHYSEELLGNGGSPIPEPQSEEITVADIKDAVSKIVNPKKENA